jgi:hypothetical protein
MNTQNQSYWQAYHQAREIEITALLTDPESAFVPFDLSNNRATLGDNAGRLTWQAAKEAGQEIDLMNTPDRIESFRDFVRSSGGWNDEETAAMDHDELNALCLQWIAGDIREAFGDAEFSTWDWAEYQADAEAGRISGRLYRGDDGKVYFNIAE